MIVLMEVILLASLPSCAIVGQGLKYLGERLVQLGGAVVVGGLAWLFYPIGLAGALVAAGAAALFAVLMEPRPTAPAGGVGSNFSGLQWLLLGVVAALILRAWAHYPKVARAVLALAKTGGRAVLGGIERKVEEAESPKADLPHEDMAP